MHTAEMTADQALKRKHRAMWAMGDFATVAAEVIPSLGPVLVEAVAAGPGTRVLDVAAGSGNAAIPAALAGADVVATDLTPELVEIGRSINDGLTWQVADAEALPFPDADFDAVLSCVGVMFAPHHQAAADELLRVCRPGGTIALASWTPEGFIGQMFAAMKPYAAAPPPGVSPPPLWGDEEHVRRLFGERVSELDLRRESVVIDRFSGPEEFRDYFKSRYGPTIAAYRGIADDAERVAALDADLAELARRHDTGTGAFEMRWEYLLVTARRA
jgi:SAM-dependent methyltransferase